MKLFLILLSLYVAGISTFSINSRVGNGEIATNAPHVCMVLVIRPELVNLNTAALGSGSIVSRRHVFTAAHLVRGVNNLFRINFSVGRTRYSFDATFALIHENFDPSNNLNDIALIFLQGGNTFPPLSIIPISREVLTPGTECTVAGHGFSSVDTIGYASINVHSATQRIAIHCHFDNAEVTQSHICGIDELSNPRGVVCLGDNGAGLYTTTVVNGTAVNKLVGIASHILPGCSTAQLTSYTQLHVLGAWVENVIGD